MNQRHIALLHERCLPTQANAFAAEFCEMAGTTAR